MQRWPILLLGLTLLSPLAHAAEGGYDPLLFAHYMPWYQSKAYSGYWGWHWTMNTMDPDKVDSTGKREIASHFYPLIGPYDSSDPAVIEYHLILIKLSGIDGLLIDWYGTHPVNDYAVIKRTVETLVRYLEKTDLKFAIVYEDRTVEHVINQTSENDPVGAVVQDLEYLKRRFFSHPNYWRVEGKPVLLNFGPVYLKDPSEWSRALRSLGEDVWFAVLNGHRRSTGTGSSPFDGEYAWVNSLAETRTWYGRTKGLPIRIGPILPGYRDFYTQGGVYEFSLNYVPFKDGETFRSFLELAEKERQEFLQLITWNDFGEGTNIEPTREYGYAYLEELQRFARLPYDTDDLRLAETFYRLRKEKKDFAAQQRLTEGFALIMAGRVDAARRLLASLARI